MLKMQMCTCCICVTQNGWTFPDEKEEFVIAEDFFKKNVETIVPLRVMAGCGHNCEFYD